MTDNRPTRRPGLLWGMRRFEALTWVGVFAATISGFAFVFSTAGDAKATQAAIHGALLDPTFVATAARAGYRVEEGPGKGPAYVLARCARSDAGGPVACDPFPAGEYPTIPGDREIRVRVLP